MVDMSVNVGGLKMKTPVTNCSGTFESGKPYADFVDVSKMGAVTAKGMSPVPWQGNETPRMCEIEGGMINCIGLQNDGVEAWIEDDYKWLKEKGATIIANVCGHDLGEYVSVIERLEEVDVDAYEVNISCPNVSCGGASLGTDAKAAAEVISACRKVATKPMSAKLTPNVTDITVIAKAVKDAGADALSLINSVQGMAIDAKTRKPKISRVIGGMAGPCLKPIALKCVYQCWQATKMAIIGMGGITSGEDAVEFMLAGATAVSIGFSNFLDPTSTIRITNEIEAFCEEQGIEKVSDLTGALQV
jgi:dihydroorotate dehydrogenase (NAD+) catalytic subunit